MDKIDERNMRDKIARSIIKGYRVHYMTQEELEAKQREEEAERLAREVYERLQAEAAADEAVKQREIQDAMRLQESYNAKTNAYSGEYGKNVNVDEVTMNQIEKILAEKEDEFKRTLAESINQKHNG